MNNTNKLQANFHLNNQIELKNRIVKSALSEVMADHYGNPNVLLNELYKCWARSNVAMLITGNIMIDRQHIAEAGNVILDKESDLISFQAWTRIVKEQKSDIQFWAQINHPGKQTPNFLTWEPVAPSSIALKGGLRTGFNKPRELSNKEINEIIEKFSTTALLAKQVGFDGIQIHAAHGYLISQFLSPLHNRRTDEWGGTIENRIKFLLAIINSSRKRVGSDFPIGIKLNSADFQKGGFSEDDYIYLIKELNKADIQLIEISGGSYESQSMIGQIKKKSTRNREAYFIEYAEKVREISKIPILLTGGFVSTKGMNVALAEKATDLIGLGRAFCVEPNIANIILEDENYIIRMPKLTTGIAWLDKMFVINISWYEHQLKNIASGLSPVKDMSTWKSILKTLSNSRIYVVKRARF